MRSGLANLQPISDSLQNHNDHPAAHIHRHGLPRKSALRRLAEGPGHHPHAHGRLRQSALSRLAEAVQC